MQNKIIILIIGLFVLMSCQEDLSISMGENLIDSETTIALVDTISVHLSTFKLDSIATSGTGYSLVGKYSDEYFGEVSSTAYLQIDIPSAYDIDDDEIYDSIVVSLPYNGMSYGDTLSPQTIRLFRVLEDIEPEDDDSYIYNVSSFSYDSEPFGEKTFIGRPNFHDELEIKLSDEFGKELFDVLQNEDDADIDNTEDFIDYFKGMALVGDEGNTTMFSFTADTSLKVTLYTHVVGETKTDLTYAFRYSSSLEQFNNISSDASGLPVGDLTTQREEIVSQKLGNMAFLQAGIGIATRVDIQGIAKVLEVEHKNILYKAELLLRPVPNSDKTVDFSSGLMLYNTGKYNELESEVTDESGSTVYADFHYDQYYNEDTYYVFDVTDYVYDELTDGYVDPDNGLVIVYSNAQLMSTVDRLVFDARSASQYRPILKLYYVFYD